MGSSLLKWKVEPAPTGLYRSFDHRGWPSATYKGPSKKVAANLRCEDDYAPWRVRTSQHKPLTLVIAYYLTDEEGKERWTYYRLKRPAATLAEAKQRIEAFILANPQIQPKEK